jgi:predicted nucleic acid-binding protein
LSIRTSSFHSSGGAHDLIIAATARHHGLKLLTDNTEEFARVPGLNVVAFAT